jgi:hypothetical protein
MNVEPTYSDKVRRLPWAIAHQSLNAVSAQITFAGPIFLLMLVQTGLTKAHIGLLLALFPLASLIALVIAPPVARFGYKRSYLVFYTARILVLSLILLTPLVITTYGQTAGALFVTIVITVFTLLRAVAETGYNPWFQEFVPNSTRSRFSIISNIAMNIVSGAGLLLAALAVGDVAGLTTYGIPFGAGLVAGIAAIVCAAMIPGGAPKQKVGIATRLSGIMETLQSSQFTTYLVGLGLISLGTAPLTFVPLLLKERAGLADGAVIGLGALTLVGSMLSNNLWNWAANRWGNKPITILSLAAVAIMPIVWLVIPVNTSWTFVSAIAVSIIAGLASSGWGVGSVGLLFNTVVPTETQADFLTTNYAWTALTGGLGLLIAGGVLEVVKLPTGVTTAIAMDGYTWLLILSFVVCTTSIFFFRQVSDYKTIRLRDLVAMVFRGNPIRAAGSLIQYRRARAESERMSVTESMGSARSMLNIDELLDAIVDPSFNVRHEAIIAIARMQPDQRLIYALVEVLHGNEPDLSISAAWALGRLGDKQAIGPLRELLGSKYSLLQARAARALATLGDADVIPLLLDKFDSEQDDGLRVAYASALGTLRSRDGVKRLLPFLYQARGNDTRMELALGLARITGNADQFVLLARRVRTENGVAFSQAVLDLKRSKRMQKIPGALIDLIDHCGTAFVREDMNTGTRLLAAVLANSPVEGSSNVHVAILLECTQRLKEFGAARPEYIILALHTLHTALNI